MFWSRCKHVACLAIALTLAAIAGPTPWAQAQNADDHQAVLVTGSTLPLAETEINFQYPGVVKDVLVKEGDHVKKDDVLITQEDSEEQVELNADLSMAASNAAIESAQAEVKGRQADLKSKEADYQAKKLEYERVLNIQVTGGGNNWEVEKAKDEMESADAARDAANGMIDSAKADVDKARLDQQQAGFKAEHQKAHLARMQRKAPADAIVQAVNVEPGDSASAESNKKACIVLEQIDVLKVEFFLPAAEAAKLTLGQKIRVSYDKKEWQEATVSFLAPNAIREADGLEKIHMMWPNPQMKTAGQTVYIELPASIASRPAPSNAAAAN